MTHNILGLLKTSCLPEFQAAFLKVAKRGGTEVPWATPQIRAEECENSSIGKLDAASEKPLERPFREDLMGTPLENFKKRGKPEDDTQKKKKK